MNFPSIDIQGSILSTDLLSKIRTEQANWQQGKDFQPDFTNAKLKDEISFAWQEAKSQWGILKSKLARVKEGETGTTETRNFWISPLLTNLGYNLSFNRQAEELNGKTFQIGFRDSNLDNFPVYVGGFFESLDKRPENKQLRVSPHAMVQEYLNYSEHLYGLVTNGRQLRLLRDATRITRLSYIEFNLEKMMEEDLYSDFVILFRLLHASRLPKRIDQGAESIIEKYHQESLEAGSKIRSKLGNAVKGAILNLANGLINHPKNNQLKEQLSEGKFDLADYYRHQLRIIYRLLFLFVIEERNLVYSESKTAETKRFNQIYFNYYSLLRLRKLAKKLPPPEANRYYDLWQGLLNTFSLFEDKKIGEKLGIMSLQGDLFGYHAITNSNYDLHECFLSNSDLLRILKDLSYFENDNRVLISVNYGGLDVEEFGSVYEGLLELKLEVKKVEGTDSYSINWKNNEGGREFQSHYTPEELVQPLIKHSLEYLIEERVNPYKGKTASKEETVNSLLKLKICDVACGSGHILLSAARRVALEVARVRTEEEQPNPVAIRKAMKEVIKECIYGVDKNPLAIELCKIALWLEAYNPGEPLNFLDHHIKCGDAVVGLAHRSELEDGIANEAFKTLTGDDKDIAKTYRDKNVKERKERVAKSVQLKAEFEKTTENSVQEAMEEYKTFKYLPENTPEEIERKAKAYRKFIDGKGFTFLKAMADTQVAQFFISKTDANKDSLMTDGDFRLILSGYKGWQVRKVAKATALALENRFFHWFIEFPELFNEGGFDCVLGNPPFLGDKKLKNAFGEYFLEYCKSYYKPAGVTDLIVYFLRRIYEVIKVDAFLAIISTNTIAQGDSKDGGLDVVVSNGGEINFAVNSVKWPGKAEVVVSLLSIYKGNFTRTKYIGLKSVASISTLLREGNANENAFILYCNQNKSFIGNYVLGLGFVLDENEALSLLNVNTNNRNCVFPYLNGDDLNSSPTQKANRWVINFNDMAEATALTSFPECFQIIEERVKPERLTKADKSSREKWWLHARNRPNLYKAISGLKRVIVTAQVSKTVAFSFVDIGQVFDSKLIVFPLDKYFYLAVLQSNFHYNWAWKYCTTMKNDLSYTPEKIFETYPFPQNLDSSKEQQLETIGEAYYEHRRQLMGTMQLGLTKTYNLFHNNAITVESINDKDKLILTLQKHLEKTANTISFNEAIEDILKLRELHVQMDNAVLDAYGWNDIQLQHNFWEVDYLPENDRWRYTIHPEARKEVLKRLLELNHKIHTEELAIKEAHKIEIKTTAKRPKAENPQVQLQLSMRPESAYEPIYSIQDIARITKLHSRTIKVWLDKLFSEGYEGINFDSKSKEKPLLVNFHGIHELIVIYDLKIKNRIPLQQILEARKWLKLRFGKNDNSFYPFTNKLVLDTISKSGKQIVFEDKDTGDIRTLGKGNAQLNLTFIKDFLQRIVFNNEMVSRLYLTDSRLLAIDPAMQGGRPCTVDGKVLVDTIKSVYEDSQSVTFVARAYNISEQAVEEALIFNRASVLN